MSPITHLIIVCCHGIYLRPPSENEANWLLAPFQTGETPTFIEHIKAGLKLLSSDEKSILVFSGSKTRPEVNKSEAASYLSLTQDEDYFGVLAGMGFGEKASTWKERIILEEKALDSFGNLLFSLVAFWRKTGTWPETITIVSHEFKRARFLDLHIKALGWPSDRVTYLGIDPEYMVTESTTFERERTEDVKRGERERGFDAWKGDLHGQGPILRGKRWMRNPWNVHQELFESQAERERSGLETSLVEFRWEQHLVKEEVLAMSKAPWIHERPR